MFPNDNETHSLRWIESAPKWAGQVHFAAHKGKKAGGQIASAACGTGRRSMKIPCTVHKANDKKLQLVTPRRCHISQNETLRSRFSA